MGSDHHLHPTDGTIRHDVTPASVGWRYLSFRVVRLTAGSRYVHDGDDREMALVPLAGTAALRAADVAATVSRTSVFDEMPHVLYAPPGVDIEVEATAD